MRHLLIIPFALLSLQAAAAPHVHGEAGLDLAVDGNVLEVEFYSPTINVAGFEHPPRRAPDQAVAVQVRHVLDKPQPLLGLNDCSLTSVTLDGTLLANDVYAAATADDDQHPDIQAIYALECKAAPTGLDLAALFQRFPGIKAVNVSVFGGSGQAEAKLTPASSKMKF